MLTGLLIAAVTVPSAMYGVHRLERWSQDCEARAAQLRAEEAQIFDHPGATDDWAAELENWRAAGQGSAVAR